MPVPSEYQRATDDFYAFLTDARDAASLGSSHQSFTMTQGVFRAFRRRLSVRDAIAFADMLPPGLRALFVTDWDTEEPQRPFGEIAEMTKEVQGLRAQHNFAPDTAIHDVAQALWRHVDRERFVRVLAALPEGAASFWRADPQ